MADLVYTIWQCPICRSDAIFDEGSENYEGMQGPVCLDHPVPVRLRPHPVYPHRVIAAPDG